MRPEADDVVSRQARFALGARDLGARLVLAQLVGVERDADDFRGFDRSENAFVNLDQASA